MDKTKEGKLLVELKVRAAWEGGGAGELSQVYLGLYVHAI
jgi:hypothetical protein